MAVKYEVLCREKSRLNEDDIGERGEGMIKFMISSVFGLLLALGAFWNFLRLGRER